MPRLRLVLLILAALLIAGGVALAAGPRAGLLLLIGLGFGVTLEGLRFGFAGPWRMMAQERDARGLIAQLMAIGLTAAVAFPLLAANPLELAPAHAPIGIGMVLGAFVFGIAMQLVMGCGSGTLVNAGSGNAVGLIALLGFVLGAWLATFHTGFGADLGQLPLISAQSIAGSSGGLVLTLAALAAVGLVALWRAQPGKRLPARRLWIAAVLLATLALANLVVAGQPWGIVYGLGLWGAKIAQTGGMDLSQTAFWANPGNAERLDASLLTDVTSLTNLGLILGAFLVMRARKAPGAPAAPLALHSWVVVIIAAIVLGYSSRMALGCNVGAYFSGISTGSLHGWAWFAAAFAGSTLGARLRPRLLVAPSRLQGAPA